MWVAFWPAIWALVLVRVTGLSSAKRGWPQGTVRGVVLDAATGAPLSRVLVADVTAGESGASTVTAGDGRFELAVPPASAPPPGVGRRLFGRRARGDGRGGRSPGGDDPPGRRHGLLGGRDRQRRRFRSADPGAPAQQVLGSADIQNLRGVLTDDPLRAVQVLPGVATGDDLRSEFTVRGSNFSHMHLTLDGFTTPYLLHAIRAVEDESSSGSVAMINSDILQDVALVSGGYVQRSGNRTGASVEFNVALGIARAAARARGGERNGRLVWSSKGHSRDSAARGWSRRARVTSISSSRGWSTTRCSSASPTRRRRSSTTSARRSACS